MIALEKFLKLPVEEVAQLIRASGPKVVVFPINGTRRWFALEYGDATYDNPIAAYMDMAGQNHIELYKLFFDHGIDTLLTPEIGQEILTTREAYMQKIGAEGLARYATHPDFLSFYKEYNVRVRFYGDYHNKLRGTPYNHLPDLFDEIAERTCENKGFRLLIGAFADDVIDTTTELAIRYHQENNKVPDRRTIIELYYGESIEQVDIFIGFDRFAVFDYPLLSQGKEDLYFTIAPSPYMNPNQLRRILYDHLFTRRAPDPDYSTMPAKDLQDLRRYYGQYRQYTFGTGKQARGIWIPDIG